MIFYWKKNNTHSSYNCIQFKKTYEKYNLKVLVRARFFLILSKSNAVFRHMHHYCGWHHQYTITINVDIGATRSCAGGVTMSSCRGGHRRRDLVRFVYYYRCPTYLIISYCNIIYVYISSGPREFCLHRQLAPVVRVTSRRNALLMARERASSVYSRRFIIYYNAPNPTTYAHRRI